MFFQLCVCVTKYVCQEMEDHGGPLRYTCDPIYPHPPSFWQSFLKANLTCRWVSQSVKNTFERSKNKLGLSWAKLSSIWDLTLLMFLENLPSLNPALKWKKTKMGST